MTNLSQCRLDTLGELLDVSVRVYRGAFRSMVLITALGTLPSSLLTLAIILASGGPGSPAFPRRYWSIHTPSALI